jgi:hypothetical protein
MKIKQLIVLALIIAVTSSTASSKDQYVVVRIECPHPNFEVHFPRHIGADPKFEFANVNIGDHADQVTISASGQVIRCYCTSHNTDVSDLTATYHYTVQRKVIECTHPYGNSRLLDCKVEP